MKYTILIHSESGNTEKVARFIQQGALSEPDTEVKIMNITDALDMDFLNESNVVVFGVPTYYANMSWQMKKWFDTGHSINLGGKLGGAFATENSPNGGGGELALTTLQQHMLVKGMLVYSSGIEFGRPIIHVGPTVVRDQIGEREEICKLFGKRLAIKGHQLFDR